MFNYMIRPVERMKLFMRFFVDKEYVDYVILAALLIAAMLCSWVFIVSTEYFADMMYRALSKRLPYCDGIIYTILPYFQIMVLWAIIHDVFKKIK